MKYPFAIIFACIASLCVLLACNEEKNKPQVDEAAAENPVDKKKKKFPSKQSDTLIIDKATAILFQPTAEQIEKSKMEVGEDTFYMGADDYLYYMNEAGEHIKSQKMPILEPRNRRFLKFVGSDKSTTLIWLDSLPDLWGIYLFDPTNKPKLVDITSIEDEYHSYYK